MAGVTRCKGDVAGRVPVLREDDAAEVTDQAIHDRQNGLCVRHGEWAAGAEIVLDVDDDEDGAGHERWGSFTVDQSVLDEPVGAVADLLTDDVAEVRTRMALDMAAPRIEAAFDGQPVLAAERLLRGEMLSFHGVVSRLEAFEV